MARPMNNILDGYVLSLSLDRYQEIMHLPIASFNGLLKPGEDPVYDCAKVWQQSQRNWLAQALADAEERRERELGYFLSPKWVIDEVHVRASDHIVLRNKHLIDVATLQETLQESPTLVYRDAGDIVDPVSISITVPEGTAADAIVVKHPDEDVTIRTDSASVVGTLATIKIQRSRLVKAELLVDRADPLKYEDDVNFMVTADVYITARISTGSVVYASRDCSASIPDCDSIVLSAGCHELIDERANRISHIRVIPTTSYSGMLKEIRVTYLSGLQSSPGAELLTARLAHTLMPNQPCSCPLVHQYWTEDRMPLQQGQYTPYGNTVGAMNAWVADSRAKIGMGGMLR